jgi:hypothetical protein
MHPRCRRSLGVLAMPSVAYFRRQADICFRLALIASDEEVSNRLIIMAQEYTDKAEKLNGDNELDQTESAQTGSFMSHRVAKFSP